MTVLPLDPRALGSRDVPLGTSADASAAGAPAFGAFVARAFADASGSLERADGAERAFADGRGSLHEMVVRRAQADIALAIATTAASRTTQALSTILGMQV